jgi:WD40 repeat protein
MSLAGRTISHYRVLSKIGEGGMGEVYKAEDTRLDRVVALKFLAPELTRDTEAKTRFVQEAKAASALDHPNICTIHEIDETDDGHLFIAMACYDGNSLKELISRGPLEPEGAVAIAQQVIQGLTQAHERGIIHRDIKPGNILITSEGLVKVVDFGLAKLIGQSHITGTGATVGTLAYMSPEQIQGVKSDHRADIWSLGVTMYEMVTGELPFGGDHPQARSYSIINMDPAPMADHLAGVPAELERTIGTCLRKSPSERYQSLGDLLAELQAVARMIAPEGEEITPATVTGLTARLTVQPYPGLASFTEAESAYFHGRESEVETVWSRLPRQDLLVIIGASGTGKTSFLQAGLMPARPEGWGMVMCSPGSSPFLALRQALVPELAGDTDAMRDLLGEDQLASTVAAMSRWRRRYSEAVLIIDQFEELFTLNPPEVQERFADLLGRLTSETGVRLVLSMRDDFLIRCHAWPALAGVFESLIPMGPLTGEGLRTALTQPAAHLGYRFEDEGFVDDMLAEVEGERGALPLLAFAMSRLWDRRDRERRLLTRSAYDEIGGVEGALARHAEAVIERTGHDRQAIVRELFRNLVTAQVTRVAREREELLSLFDESQREDASEILRQLIHARLLTSFDVPREDAEDSHRVEIVHESLLSSWPRLVRWQTQDADSAQFHDQIRQAADMWHGKDCPNDLLWSGTLYNEFVLWRERYPGGLTDTESEFSRAMTDKARQKKRRRVAVVAGVFAALVVVLAGVTSLWQKSEVAQERATEQALKAEANYLISLSGEAVERDPTEAVAYAIASLDREDSREARQLALESLAEAPARFEFRRRLKGRNPFNLAIAPDGNNFVVGWGDNGLITIHEAVGDSALEISGLISTVPTVSMVLDVRISRSGRLLVTSNDSTVCVWSLPGGELVKRIRLEGDVSGFITPDEKRILTCEFILGKPLTWRSWPIGDGAPELLGTEGEVLDRSNSNRDSPEISPDFRWISDYVGKEVFVYPVDDLEDPGRRRVGAHEYRVEDTEFDASGERLASVDFEGWVRVWDLSAEPPALVREFMCPGDKARRLRFSPDGRFLLTAWSDGVPRVWDLEAPVDARPVELEGHTHWAHDAQFHPNGRWVLSVGNGKGVAAWPRTRSVPLVLENEKRFGQYAEFLPDGKSLITIGVNGAIWHVPLAPPDVAKPRLIMPDRQWAPTGLVVDRTGKYAAACSFYTNLMLLISIEDGRVVELEDAPAGSAAAQFSADSRLLFALTYTNPNPLQVWDVETGEKKVIGPQDKEIQNFRLTDDGRLFISYEQSLWEWDIDSDTPKLVRDNLLSPEVLPSGRRALYVDQRKLYILDLESGESTSLVHTWGQIRSSAVNDDETLVAVCTVKDETANVELIPLTGGEPHVLYVYASDLDFDPSGRRLAISNPE